MQGIDWEQVAKAALEAIEHERAEWRRLLELIRQSEQLVLGVDVAQVRREAGLRPEEDASRALEGER